MARESSTVLVGTAIALMLSWLTLQPLVGLVVGALAGHGLVTLVHGIHPLLVDAVCGMLGMGVGMISGARAMVRRVIETP